MADAENQEEHAGKTPLKNEDGRESDISPYNYSFKLGQVWLSYSAQACGYALNCTSCIQMPIGICVFSVPYNATGSNLFGRHAAANRIDENLNASRVRI